MRFSLRAAVVHFAHSFTSRAHQLALGWHAIEPARAEA
jgi:hypothetical protein